MTSREEQVLLVPAPYQINEWEAGLRVDDVVIFDDDVQQGAMDVLEVIDDNQARVTFIKAK
jgi:hypothetical protein